MNKTFFGSFLALCLLSTLCIDGEARLVIVGDKSKQTYSWTTNYNYTKWRIQNPLYIGDIAVFIYPPGTETVWQVPTKQAFDSCDFSDAIALGGRDDGQYPIGFQIVVTGQPQYIVCGIYVHCRLGQKVALNGTLGPLPIPKPSPPPSPVQAGPWIKDASATFMGNDAGTNNFGACYGDSNRSLVLGKYITGLSAYLYGPFSGNECGSCYQLKCVLSRACNKTNQSVIVTAGNYCSAGNSTTGRCSYPKSHFVLTKPAFNLIAYFYVGAIPVEYRRIACPRSGKIMFTMGGNKWWIVASVTNVGGPGSIRALYIKGTKTEWFLMRNTWGTSWRINYQPQLYGQALSFKLVSHYSNLTIEAKNVAPANWEFGQTYRGGQFPKLL